MGPTSTAVISILDGLLVSGITMANDYAIDVVAFELQMRSGESKVISSFSQRRLFQLGDAVAIAILKLLDDTKLTDRNTSEAILVMIEDAFSHPTLISNKQDKEPRISMFLLRYLRFRFSDHPDMLHRIERTIEFLSQQTRGLEA